MTRASAPRPRILIVDDEPAVLTALQLAFEGRDWHVEVVISVATAVARVTADSFDLLLVDKNLPDGDGLSFIRQVRARNRVVRIIMITGYATQQSAVGAANLGVDAYLEKPFRDIFAVTRTVEEALAKQGLPPEWSQLDAEPVRSEPLTRALTRLTVLLASMDARTRDAIAARFATAMVPILVAATPEATLRLAREQPPHAILLGPSSKLVELTRQVRALAPKASLIIISDSLEIDAVKALIGARITALIDEPLGSAAFQERIGGVVAAVERRLQRHP